MRVSKAFRVASWAPRTCASLSCAGIVLAGVSLTAAPITGAQEKAKDLTGLSLEDLMNVQVYSASKHLQKTTDAPSAVTMVTADEIQKYGYRTLADILESVRGFYITYDRDYSFVGVRGFGRLGDSNNRILVLIDGHRINDNVFGEPYLGSEFLTDIDQIERVEIIRGPSSSLYGADAFFAVINVITRKPSEMKGLELAFAGASFGTYQGRASYGGEYRGIGVTLSGTFFNSTGPLLFFPGFDDPADNNGITRDTDYESYQHMIATVRFGGFTVQGLFSNRDKGVPTGYYGALFNDPQTQNFDRHQYIDIAYQHTMGERWDLTARTSYDHTSLRAPVAYSTGLPGDSTVVDTYAFQGNWWDSEVSLNRTLWRKHKVTLGTEITDNLKQNQDEYASNVSGSTVVPWNSVDWAIYGQDEFTIHSNLVLSTGIRYDHYPDFGGTTNPRLGLIYHVWHPTTLKLLYGTAFRAPEPFEMRPDYGPFYDNNVALRPESIRSVEGVAEQAIGEHFTLSGSVFRNWIDKLITVEVNPSDELAIFENAQSAHATGSEIQLDGRFARGVRGSASYSFTDCEEPATKAILANSPRNLAKLNLSVPVWGDRVFAGVDAQYTSSVQTLAGNTLGGFPVFNATLFGHALGKHLDLSGSIYNIFNKKYSDPGRPEDPEDSIPQDGTTFRMRLVAKL